MGASSLGTFVFCPRSNAREYPRRSLAFAYLKEDKDVTKETFRDAKN